MRRREYVHTYISDIQTIHKHAKSISNTKIPSAHHVPHNPFLHPVSNILNTQNLFFRTPGVHVGTTSAPCPRAWVGRPNLARARVPHSRTRAHRTTAMSAIFTTSMSAKASAKVRLASASPRARRSRVYPRAHPRRERTSSESRARRPRTRDARASSIAARAVKRNTKTFASIASSRARRRRVHACTHASIHPSDADRSDASRGLNRTNG